MSINLVDGGGVGMRFYRIECRMSDTCYLPDAKIVAYEKSTNHRRPVDDPADDRRQGVGRCTDGIVRVH